MKRALASTFFACVLSAFAIAQSTEFTYQGNLSVSGSPAIGNYDFEFALFDALTSGAQLGSTLTRSSVAVAAGTFSVKLDFGAQFPGANRFPEIRVRQTGGGAFQLLSPRQQINSTPYSIKSVDADIARNATNATELGGVAAAQYVVTTDPRMTDARPPTAGSASYIQNQNAGPQPASNFNISSNAIIGGNVGINTASPIERLHITGNARITGTITTTELNNGTTRVFRATGSNLYVGQNTGLNTTGAGNTFVGGSAGGSTTTGTDNTFVGLAAGFVNTTGIANTFVGVGAGNLNTASGNAFFG